VLRWEEEERGEDDPVATLKEKKGDSVK